MTTVSVRAPVDVTRQAAETGAFARHGLDPGGRVTNPSSGEFVYFPPDWDTNDAAQRTLFSDERLREAVERERRPPKPATPASPPPEGVPDTGEAIAICTSPDVCKTPVGAATPPIPYMVWGKASDDRNYSPNVFYNGFAAKRFASVFTTTYGDEPGTAKGVKSGTVGDVVRPIAGSPVVYVNGQAAIRHGDPCTLNKDNCPGEYRHVKDTGTRKGPDGTDENDRKGAWSRFKDRFVEQSETAQDAASAWDKAKEWWRDPSQAGRDAKALYESLPSGERIWQGAKNAASAVGAGARQVASDPVGSARAGAGWARDQAAGAWDAGSEIYRQDGAPGLAGAGLGVAAEVVSPSKKLKMVKRGAEALDEAGDVTRAARTLDNEPVAGNDGVRVSDPKKTTYKRPSGYRKGVRDKVWEEAKDPDGQVRDPVTQEVMKRDEPWDMGHKPGYEFRKHQDSAEQRGIDRETFLDEHNSPSHYRPELPSSNRSHKGEDKSDDYFGD